MIYNVGMKGKMLWTFVFLFFSACAFADVFLFAKAEPTTLTFDLSHVTSPEQTVELGEDITVVLTAEELYVLPEDVEVIIGETTLDKEDYGYENGVVTISGAFVIAPVTVRASATPRNDVLYREAYYLESLTEEGVLYEGTYYAMYSESEKTGVAYTEIDAEEIEIEGAYLFAAPKATLVTDVEVRAYYKRNVFSLTADEVENGEIEILTPTFKYGQKASFNVFPADRYSIENVYIDGASQLVATSYEITPNADVVVYATFSKNLIAGVTVNGINKVYDGEYSTLSVEGGENISAYFAGDKEGDYSQTIPFFKDVTSVVVYYRMEKSNYFPLEGKVDVIITPLLVEKPVKDDSVFVYNTLPQTYSLAESVYYAIENAVETSAGEYTVKAILKEKGNYLWTDGSFEDLTYPFIINKATYDLDLTFDSASFVFDGSEKRVYVEGEIPDGVTVTYENNGQTEVGIYKVTACFSVDERNYEKIADMQTTMFILYASLDGVYGSVDVSSKDGFDPRAVLVANAISPDVSSVLRLKFNQKAYAVYDVYFEENGYEPKTEYTVKLDVPDNAKKIKVYLIDEGIKEMDFVYENGKIVLNTSSLGKLAVVGVSFPSWFLILSAVLVSALLVVGISLVALSKKKMASVGNKPSGDEEPDFEEEKTEETEPNGENER